MKKCYLSAVLGIAASCLATAYAAQVIILHFAG